MLAVDSRVAAPSSAEVVPAAEGERPALELLVDFAVRDASAAEGTPALEYGTVVSADGELMVTLGQVTMGTGALGTDTLGNGTLGNGTGARAARRAKSCLVAPELGDRVLCSRDGETVYVLAVLESASATTRIQADGDLELQADTLRLRAKSAIAALGEVQVFGRSLDAHFADKVTLFAERVESRATTLVQRTKQVFRFVEALEQVRAGVFDLRAESLAAIRGENTILAARVLAKLDGEQVKIG